MAAGEPPGHGQAEPDTGAAGPVAEPLERLEDPLAVGRAHAGTPVDDPQVDPVADLRRPRCGPAGPSGA